MKSSELLTELLERPALYVGHGSVPLIHDFICGYDHANYLSGNKVHDDLYAGFNEYVARRYKITTSHNWASIVVFMVLSEASAFALAKDLWAKYKSEASQTPKDE